MNKISELIEKRKLVYAGELKITEKLSDVNEAAAELDDALQELTKLTRDPDVLAPVIDLLEAMIRKCQTVPESTNKSGVRKTRGSKAKSNLPESAPATSATDPKKAKQQKPAVKRIHVPQGPGVHMLALSVLRQAFTMDPLPESLVEVLQQSHNENWGNVKVAVPQKGKGRRFLHRPLSIDLADPDPMVFKFLKAAYFNLIWADSHSGAKMHDSLTKLKAAATPFDRERIKQMLITWGVKLD